MGPPLRLHLRKNRRPTLTPSHPHHPPTTPTNLSSTKSPLSARHNVGLFYSSSMRHSLNISAISFVQFMGHLSAILCTLYSTCNFSSCLLVFCCLHNNIHIIIEQSNTPTVFLQQKNRQPIWLPILAFQKLNRGLVDTRCILNMDLIMQMYLLISNYITYIYAPSPCLICLIYGQ